MSLADDADFVALMVAKSEAIVGQKLGKMTRDLRAAEGRISALENKVREQEQEIAELRNPDKCGCKETLERIFNKDVLRAPSTMPSFIILEDDQIRRPTSTPVVQKAKRKRVEATTQMSLADDADFVAEMLAKWEAVIGQKLGKLTTEIHSHVSP